MRKSIAGVVVFCIVFVVLFVSATYSYHVGFKAGLNTKVTVVGEKYVMKVKTRPLNPPSK